ncbi:Sensor histidine kinase RcsC [Marinomonas aquimarina]|uniref:histidine kinase n=1 Tax=Marinomonas aquimarina TaxID=295068 RepID=A0A1A8TGG0_9GAMM|nr:HAMP domain-containing sensor histidine kinase [Marinomonas aquimarina]SBS31056.1 Sensor histidine kinase RcsC [Marinomonas aquimarina]
MTPETPKPDQHRKRTLINLLLICVCTSSLLTLLLLPLTDSSARLNARQVFDSSRWHSLQLQLQTYRLMNYLSDLSAEDLPVNGNAYFQYDLVLSRVDLLRKGDLGRHIRNFANGRATRLLNIISGELELISLNIEHLENGRLDQVPIIMARLRLLDSQVTDFVVIVNQGANDYVTNKRAELDVQLEYIQWISVMLLCLSAGALLITFKLAQKLRRALRYNYNLERQVQAIRRGKVEVIGRMTNELKSSLTGIISHLSSLQQHSTEQAAKDVLEQSISQNSLIQTQLDGYHDLVLIEAFQLQPNVHEGNVRDQLEYTAHALEHIFSAHNIRALCHVDPRLPTLVDADYQRLHEMLTLLILNLAPFCTDAELLINLRPSKLPLLHQPAKHGDKATKMVQIGLRDAGAGLPEAIQTGLRANPFNPNNTVLSQIEQMGLGFTLCHYLIGALDGELHFTSSSGKGSEIWIDLPLGVGTFVAEPETTPAAQSIAILNSNTLLDQGLQALLEPRYTVQCLSEEELAILALNTTEAPFSWLLISDKATLSAAQLEYVTQLQRLSVKIIWCSTLAQQHPDVDADAVYHYPITLSQLTTLLGASD